MRTTPLTPWAAYALMALMALSACSPHDEHGDSPYGDDPPPTRSVEVDEDAFPAKPPPFSEGIFPCSRCHAGGGEAAADTLPAMPHAAHLAKGLECVDCHFLDDEDAEPERPSFEVCAECHDDLDEAGESVRAYFDATRQDDDTYVFPDRWKTRDVTPQHAKHRDADVACSACHGEASNSAFTKPKPVPLMQRCVDCHTERKAPLDCKTCHTEVTEKQHDFVLHHAEDQRGCLDCHNPLDRDTLRLANGKTVAFTESYKLCGQCHGPKLRDWKLGLHGKRTGEWNGRREYMLCAHCHNPHAPRFPKMKPLPPPQRPGEVR